MTTAIRRRSFEPRLFRSPIHLPEATSGRLAVLHSTLQGVVPIVGNRQALLRGISPVSVRLDQPLRIHELVEDGSVWMSDRPEELNQIGELLHTFRPTGHVLVGGLGLGILATLLAQRSGIDSVTVVEISPDVISLCARPGYTVVQADLLEFLRKEERRFDAYLLDTWRGTGECEWWDTVVPLRRTIRNRHGKTPRIWCWAEDIMLGQIHRALEASHRFWKTEKLPLFTPAQARAFTRNVGTPDWERRYGNLVP